MDRNVKTNFWPAQNVRRQLVLHQAAQNVFGLRPAQLERLRQSRGEINDAWIEKWRPRFQRMRHTHAVDLIKDVVRQVVTLIELQIALQARPGAHVSQNLSQRTSISKVEEPAFLRFSKRSVPVDVRHLRRKQRSMQKALQLVFKANLVVGDRQQPGATEQSSDRPCT